MLRIQLSDKHSQPRIFCPAGWCSTARLEGVLRPAVSRRVFVRLDQNTGIRFNIMLIAVLGGFGFLCYLLVNVHLANANKDRLNELLNHHYPVIEQIRRLKQDADSIRESLTAAVALEDGFMVEDSIELANRFRDSAGRLA